MRERERLDNISAGLNKNTVKNNTFQNQESSQTHNHSNASKGVHIITVFLIGLIQS